VAVQAPAASGRQRKRSNDSEPSIGDNDSGPAGNGSKEEKRPGSTIPSPPPQPGNRIWRKRIFKIGEVEGNGEGAVSIDGPCNRRRGQLSERRTEGARLGRLIVTRNGKRRERISFREEARHGRRGVTARQGEPMRKGYGRGGRGGCSRVLSDDVGKKTGENFLPSAVEKHGVG